MEVFYVPSSFDQRYDFMCVCVQGRRWDFLTEGDQDRRWEVGKWGGGGGTENK